MQLYHEIFKKARHKDGVDLFGQIQSGNKETVERSQQKVLRLDRTGAREKGCGQGWHRVSLGAGKIMKRMQRQLL